MTEALPQTDLLHPSEARFDAVALALAHWDQLRAGRPMPQRDEIDPRALAQALEFMFVAEPVAPGVARLRLAGQHLHLLLGMEPRGMPLCALFEGPARAEIADAVDQVVRHGVRVLMPVRSEGGLGRPAIEGLLALMPLADGEGKVHRLLGAMQTRGGIGRTPRRLTLSGPARRLMGTPATGTPELAAAGGPGRPTLRVIRGGRA
jgi:hypothetical protein